MELFVVGALVAIALGLFVYKTYQLVLFVRYPLPGEDLKWKQSPSLPFRDISGKASKKQAKAKKSKNKRRFDSEPLARSEIPLESVSIEEQSSMTIVQDVGKISSGTDV